QHRYGERIAAGRRRAAAARELRRDLDGDPARRLRYSDVALLAPEADRLIVDMRRPFAALTTPATLAVSLALALAAARATPAAAQGAPAAAQATATAAQPGASSPQAATAQSSGAPLFDTERFDPKRPEIRR